MNIVVLNGSPKGELSVTVQYIRFIKKKFPQHRFKLLNISHNILKFEKQAKNFLRVIDEVKESDGVIWAFPLYVFLVPSQYKRFIEMIWENGVQSAFSDKYTCILTTSIHFFDHTAHSYMQGICDDLNMKFTESFSADMDDLFTEDRRRILLKWADNFLTAIEYGLPTSKLNVPLSSTKFVYKPGKATARVETRGMKVMVLADVEDEKSNIVKMVRRFKGAFKNRIDVVKLQEIDIRGGCLGCMQCAFDNICVYRGKDGFMEFYNSKMGDHDVVIFAGAIKDRFLSSRIKMFWDRSFFKGHASLHIDRQVGFIISGPLAQLANTQEVLQAEAEMSDANYIGAITDESGDSSQIDELLDAFAFKCVDYAQQKYLRPKTFLGVGGHKIFRDQIWSRLRFPFDADFRFYESHGLFDFPQNDTRYLEFSRKMISMIQDPAMREMVRKMIKTEMLKGYQKIVETK